MASREEVVEVVNMVGAAYPWVNMTKDTINVWLLVLQDIDGDGAKAAALDLLNQPNQYPPSAGMIRQRAFDLAGGGDDGWETGWQAWKKHLNECRQPEYLCPHDLATIYDAVTAHTVRAIGWQTLARMDADQEATIRAQFRDIWKAQAARQAERDRRHPAVQQVVDAYRQRIEAHAAPRVAAPVMADLGGPQDIRPAGGDISAILDAGGRPRRAELDAIIRRVAAQRGGVL